MEKLEFEIKKKKKPAPHKKAYWCDLISDMIKRPITHVLGFTKDWPIEMIRDSYLQAQHRKNPAKYWWWYRKETKL